MNYLEELPRELLRQICLYIDISDINSIDNISPNTFEDELFWKNYFELRDIIPIDKRPSIKDHYISLFIKQSRNPFVVWLGDKFQSESRNTNHFPSPNEERITNLYITSIQLGKLASTKNINTYDYYKKLSIINRAYKCEGDTHDLLLSNINSDTFEFDVMIRGLSRKVYDTITKDPLFKNNKINQFGSVIFEHIKVSEDEFYQFIKNIYLAD